MSSTDHRISASRAFSLANLVEETANCHISSSAPGTTGNQNAEVNAGPQPGFVCTRQPRAKARSPPMPARLPGFFLKTPPVSAAAGEVKSYAGARDLPSEIWDLISKFVLIKGTRSHHWGQAKVDRRDMLSLSLVCKNTYAAVTRHLYRTMPLQEIALNPAWQQACINLARPGSGSGTRASDIPGAFRPLNKAELLSSVREGYIDNGYRDYMPIYLSVNILPHLAHLARRKTSSRLTIPDIDIKQETICRTMTWRLDRPAYTCHQPSIPASIKVNELHNCHSSMKWRIFLLPGCVNKVFLRVGSPITLASIHSTLDRLDERRLWDKFCCSWKGYDLSDTKFEFVVSRIPRMRNTAEEFVSAKEADQRVLIGLKRLVDGWNWTFGSRGSKVPVSVAYANTSAKCGSCCKCGPGEKKGGSD